MATYLDSRGKEEYEGTAIFAKEHCKQHKYRYKEYFQHSIDLRDRLRIAGFDPDAVSKSIEWEIVKR
jgi:hypothetical protein